MHIHLVSNYEKKKTIIDRRWCFPTFKEHRMYSILWKQTGPVGINNRRGISRGELHVISSLEVVSQMSLSGLSRKENEPCNTAGQLRFQAWNLVQPSSRLHSNARRTPGDFDKTFKETFKRPMSDSLSHLKAIFLHRWKKCCRVHSWTIHEQLQFTEPYRNNSLILILRDDEDNFTKIWKIQHTVIFFFIRKTHNVMVAWRHVFKCCFQGSLRF